MPSVEELLSGTEVMADSITYCEIDDATRQISVPEEYRILGVESDEKAKRLYFRCPKIVGNNNVDLTDCILFINYRNAGGELDAYRIPDAEEDSSGEYITFSWELYRRVTAYHGDVAFSFCAMKQGEIEVTNEYNTTINTQCTCLEGLEATERVEETNADAIVQIWEAIDQLKASGGGGGTGGTTNYNDLTNRPQINGIELVGNRTASALGLVESVGRADESGKMLVVDKNGTVVASDALTEVLISMLTAADGVTDDHAILQEILNSNLHVKFPNAKQYYISEPLRIRSDHNIDLSGSTIIVDGDYAAFAHTTSQDAVARVHIYDGFIEGNCTVSKDTGERVYNYPNQCGLKIASFHSTYENLTFTNLAYGIYLDKRTTGSSGLVENRIYNVKFAGCKNTAIHSDPKQSITDGILKNVKVGGDGYDHALYLYSGGGWVIDGFHCYGESLYKVEVKNCDNTCLSNFLIAGDYSEIGLILNLYSNAIMSNMALWGNTDGSTMIQVQQSTSQTYPQKTVNASNITLTCQVDGITVNSITGYGELYCSGLVYNDRYGCIQPPTLKVRSAMDVSLRNGVAIPSTGDLNEYTDPGNYAVQTQYALNGIQNLPVKQFGRLTVLEAGGPDSGNTLYRKQIYEPCSMNHGDRYVRTMFTSDGGTSWSFTDWVEASSSGGADTSLYKTVDAMEEIPSGSDLNDYTEPGNYGIKTDVIVGSVENVPVTVGGRITVVRMLAGTAEDKSQYIKQTYETYTTANGIYERYATTSDTGASWTWHDWIHISTEEYVDESIDGLKEEYRAINYAAGIFTGSDFDDYTTPGNYAVKVSASISGISNMPVNQIGRLTVDNILGSLSTDSSRSVKQTYEPFSSDYGLRYERTGRTNDSGISWEWKDWEQLIPMSKVVELIESMAKTLQSATGVYSGSDLNEYRTPGNYVIKSDSIANNVSNVPIANAGRLTVINILDEESDATYQNVKQVYEPYSTSHNTYIRSARTTDGGSSWVWQEWKEINGNTGSGSSATPRQEMKNTDTTVTIEPNKLYVFPEMASLTVTLGTPSDTNVANEYHFFFTSGATATTLTLNDVLSDAYSVEANMKYEVSILEGVAYIKGVPTGEA